MAEEASPEFKSAVFSGGAGDQGAGQLEMGAALEGSSLYLSGADRYLFGGQALFLKHALPTASSPLLRVVWPNKLGSRGAEDEVFCDVAAGPTGLYCAGRSWSQTVDGMGGKEHKAVLVKFPAGGAGAVLWTAKPIFFPPYKGHESFMALALAQEGGSTAIYCAGRAQANGANNTAVLAKFDDAGKTLWTRMLGDMGGLKNSFGTAVAAAGGHVFVAGSTSYPYTDSGATRLALWKLDPKGNLVFAKSFPHVLEPGWTVAGIAAQGQHLYLVSTLKGTAETGTQALIMKCDLAGNALWSHSWGGPKAESGYGVAASAERVYAVGKTISWTGGGADCFLLELNAANGEEISVLHYGGVADDRAMRVLLSGKELYVTGDSRSFLEGGNLAGQLDLLTLRYTLTAPPPALRVLIDIKPGEVPNPVNLKSRGNIPVAILSSKDFNAPGLVDPKSLTFGHEGMEQSFLRAGKEDVSGDRLPDLVCHFDTVLAGFREGDTQGMLRGKLISGKPIIGSDSLVIAGEPKQEKAPAPAPVVAPARRAAPAPAPAPVVQKPRAPSPVVAFLQAVVRRIFTPPPPRVPAPSRTSRR